MNNLMNDLDLELKLELENNLPSLCIPRVSGKITKKNVEDIFNKLELGKIDRIELTSKKIGSGEISSKVIIHFKTWYSNSNAIKARELLLENKGFKVFYDEPWFWKVSALSTFRKNGAKI
jgi:hypothetical protein